tara:strand:+ start:1969 stop:3081 length:1113 start_codon:yes stop_codon:yes gene_type:complete
MKARIVSIEDIPAELSAKWNSWAAPGGRLTSPYLRFEFTQAIAAARGDVRIAVIEENGEAIGVFPHHLARDGVVRPVGAPMSDYQGILTAPGHRICPGTVLQAGRGSALVFDNWYNPLGSKGHHGREGSTVADLSEGAARYFDTRRSQFPSHFRKLDRLQRSAIRQFGPMRVEWTDPSGEAFGQLRRWKQAQYQQTGKLNVFGIDWVQMVLNDLRQRDTSEFSGRTVSLWFGDTLAAVEFGLAAGGVYHSWFPAYDPALAKYSPGLLLLHGIFADADTQGIARVDLGRGGAHYKKYYASYEVPLDQGRILTPGLASLGIRSWEMAEAAVQLMPPQIAGLPGRIRRRWAQASAFEPRLAPRLMNLATSISL